jgi:large subunit ribosomal protein L5
MSRLQDKYWNEIQPALQKELGIGNVHAVPKIHKIVVNMGVGEAVQNRNALDKAIADMTTITGQKPLITRARNSVASFKLREGMEIGCKVTMRGERMYEFLDRLISVAIPRVRDFRGLSDKSFDNNGNYSMGLQEQFVFPEINIANVEKSQGMDITIVMNTGNKAHSHALLTHFGMPFIRREETANS